MVEPAGFGANPETAGDNAFQSAVPVAEAADVETRARAEFRALVEALEARGIEVVTFVPAGNHRPPDSVFPNNWFSTHPDGSWVLYPMMAPSRRRERGSEIVDWLESMYGDPVDLTAEEARGRYLEGTGSLVIDEPARVVYASRSSRTDEDLVASWAERFGYRAVVFDSVDRDGRPIYHTNVVLTLGTGYAIVCAEAIEPPESRRGVLAELAKSGRAVVEIGFDQLHAFCGNALELAKPEGGLLLVMSERAWRAMTAEQQAVLEGFAEVLRADIGTIETHGGGSARCMLAELY
jgi:hypothetical protein